MGSAYSFDLLIKSQNDQFGDGWESDEGACNWYVDYIAQGRTKGGNKPSNVKDQYSDGSTYYEPKHTN